MLRKPVRPAPGPSLRAVGAAATGDDLDLCMAAVLSHGDKAAFGRLVQHFAPRLIGFFVQDRASRAETARASRAQAEEIALETLAALWRDAALYDPRQTTLAAFVFVLARNLLVERAAGPGLACAGGSPEGDKVLLAQATARLRAALENGM